MADLIAAPASPADGASAAKEPAKRQPSRLRTNDAFRANLARADQSAAPFLSSISPFAFSLLTIERLRLATATTVGAVQIRVGFYGRPAISSSPRRSHESRIASHRFWHQV